MLAEIKPGREQGQTKGERELNWKNGRRKKMEKLRTKKVHAKQSYKAGRGTKKKANPNVFFVKTAAVK